jgi:Ribonuclease HI
MARAAQPQDGPGLFDVARAELESRPMSTVSGSARRLIVEADGGSRGNPGPAAYGALVRDAGTGEVLDSEGLTLGITTNNVAEYSGLIAGLEMARGIDAGAEVDVRMDSRLVIEQQAGRWKVKHPAMRPLAAKARTLHPSRVSWTWVPREQNKAADALVNAALDGKPKTRR